MRKRHEYLARFALRLPFINRWHPWIQPHKTDMRWLPINEDIELPGDTPMPAELLHRIIDEASTHVVVDYCPCRGNCESYPREIGCLLMGSSAVEVKRFPFHEVSAAEAHRHADMAIEAGLVPIIGKARVDNFFFDVPDRRKLLTVCFCCECCCVTRFEAFLPLKHLEPMQGTLEGLTVTVDEAACTGCGRCVKSCYVRAISIRSGTAVINEYCRACGRCAGACPTGAITVRIASEEYIEKALEQIRTYVDYS